jgi:hypothetical protein
MEQIFAAVLRPSRAHRRADAKKPGCFDIPATA